MVLAMLCLGSRTARQCLTGILNAGVPSQANGTDPTPTAILKAATLIQANAYADPDGIVLRPNARARRQLQLRRNRLPARRRLLFGSVFFERAR
jgi:hypothetical protein